MMSRLGAFETRSCSGPSRKVTWSSLFSYLVFMGYIPSSGLGVLRRQSESLGVWRRVGRGCDDRWV